MKKLNRVLVIVLAVVMMFSGMATNVRALDADEHEMTYEEFRIIELAVAKAYTTGEQEYIDIARPLVEALPDGFSYTTPNAIVTKEGFLNQLASAQKVADKKAEEPEEPEEYQFLKIKNVSGEYNGKGYSIEVEGIALDDTDIIEYRYLKFGTTYSEWSEENPSFTYVKSGQEKYTVQVRVMMQVDQGYEELERGTGYVEITPKLVTVNVHDKEKYFGEKDPEFTYDIEGLIEGDESMVIKLQRYSEVIGDTPDEKVGFYKGRIVATYNTALQVPKYKVIVNLGDFTINKSIDFPVTKIWSDANDQDGLRPEEITIKLLANNEPTDETLTLNSANNWTDSFIDLDHYIAGEEVEYNIEEVSVPGYNTVITGNMEDGFTVTNSHTPEAIPPILTLEKLVEENSFSQVGDELHYSFTVKNEGTVPVVKLTVNDPKLGIVDFQIDLTLTPLAVGETYTHVFNTPYIVTEADVAANGPIINVLTVIAETEKGYTAEFEDDVTVPFEQVASFVPPVLTLEKSVEENSFSQVGDELHYSFTVKNEGIVPVVKLTVNDPKLGIENLIIDLTDDPLMPGETYTYTFNQAYVISATDVETGKVENKLTVIGETAEGAKLELTDSVTVTLERVLPHLPKTGERYYYLSGLAAVILGGAFVILLIKRRQQLKQD